MITVKSQRTKEYSAQCSTKISAQKSDISVRTNRFNTFINLPKNKKIELILNNIPIEITIFILLLKQHLKIKITLTF